LNGFWVFRDKASGQFVSRSGLRNVNVGGNNEVELTYALLSNSGVEGWRQKWSMQDVKVGEEQVGKASVVCFPLTTNRTEQVLMENAGFKYERDIIHASLPYIFYHITVYK